MFILTGLMLAAIAAVLLALLLPIRIFIRAAGGAYEKARASGGVLICGGAFGVGGVYGDGRMKLSLLLGRRALVTMDATRLLRRPKRPKPEAGAREKGGKPREGEPVTARLSPADRIRGWSRAVRKYRYFAGLAAREALALVRIDRFDVRVKLGLADPSLTGSLAGVLYAINGVLPERYAIRPECEFNRPEFSCDADIALTFRSHVFWVHLARELRTYSVRRRAWRVSPCGGTPDGFRPAAVMTAREV